MNEQYTLSLNKLEYILAKKIINEVLFAQIKIINCLAYFKFKHSFKKQVILRLIILSRNKNAILIQKIIRRYLVEKEIKILTKASKTNLIIFTKAKVFLSKIDYKCLETYYQGTKSSFEICYLKATRIIYCLIPISFIYSSKVMFRFKENGNYIIEKWYPKTFDFNLQIYVNIIDISKYNFWQTRNYSIKNNNVPSKKKNGLIIDTSMLNGNGNGVKSPTAHLKSILKSPNSPSSNYRKRVVFI